MATVQTPIERLGQWIERSKLNQTEAAAVIGMEKTQLSHILNAKRTPGLQNAVKIERATGIPAEAWLSTEMDETAEAVGAGPRKSRVGKA